MKHVFVIIRYSILSSENKYWVVSKREFESYKEHLFSEERMVFREHFFEAITLKSLVKSIEQAPKDMQVNVLILTSVYLPEKNYNNLLSFCEKIPNAMIASIDEKTNYVFYIEDYVKEFLVKKDSQNSLYCTVRLDDDAVSDDYFNQLGSYFAEAYSGCCVSFGKGFNSYYDGLNLKGYQEIYYPKIAIGLAHVSKGDANGRCKTVYSVGDHTKVDMFAPLVLDSRRKSFICTIHQQSDMSQRNKLRNKDHGDLIPEKNIKRWFS